MYIINPLYKEEKSESFSYYRVCGVAAGLVRENIQDFTIWRTDSLSDYKQALHYSVCSASIEENLWFTPEPVNKPKLHKEAKELWGQREIIINTLEEGETPDHFNKITEEEYLLPEERFRALMKEKLISIRDFAIQRSLSKK